MEQQATLRFSHYEDEELAAFAQQTLKQLVNKTESVVTALTAFSEVLEKSEGNKRKALKRDELENRLASILDN